MLIKRIPFRPLALIAVFAALLAAPGLAVAQSPTEHLTGLAPYVKAALDRVNANDVPGARSAYEAFNSGWGPIEDGVREESAGYYSAIEAAKGDSGFALSASPPNVAAAKDALTRLSTLCADFIAGRPYVAPAGSQANPNDVTVASVYARLNRADDLLGKNDPASALSEIVGFRTAWPIVEGLVKAKSDAVYASTENNMAKAYGLLTQPSPDTAAARATVQKMKDDLAPYAQGKIEYTIFDAAIILLREGLEALLVVGALLAFLRRTNNADKAKWIYVGSGAGIVASVIAAFAITIAFSKASAGVNRELLEGFVGLFAAVMLIYMAWWLHSKASLGAWHKYISTTASNALAKNGLISLSFLAFLAIFREGAETILFYVGIAPGISAANLALGIAIATAGLVLVGVLIFVLGVRVPVAPFFRASSVLIYYLAFKFIGSGVHALQVAGKVSSHTNDHLFSNNFLGLYPNWETTSAQLALLLLAGFFLLYSRLQDAAKKHRAVAASQTTPKVSSAKSPDAE